MRDLQSLALPLGYAGPVAQSRFRSRDCPGASCYDAAAVGARHEGVKIRLFCTIPQPLIQQPLLFTLVNRFQVVPNIRGASVTENIAILSLEIEGEDAKVAQAVEFLRAEGVQVEFLKDEEPAV